MSKQTDIKSLDPKIIRTARAVKRRKIMALKKLADHLKAIKQPGTLIEAEWKALIWAIPQLESLVDLTNLSPREEEK